MPPKSCQLVSEPMIPRTRKTQPIRTVYHLERYNEVIAMPHPRASQGHGVGPSLLGEWSRDRGLRFALGLAVAVAVPVAILFYFRFHSLDNRQRASTVVLQQLSE